MIFIYIIIGTVIIGIAYAIYNEVQNSKHKNKSKDIFDNLEDFKADEVYLSETSGISIGYDAKRLKICLLNSDHKTIIYNYKDILQSELDIDGETISKQSTTGTVGRAVLGEILAGGAGAIIGGVTGSKKQKEKIKSIDLKLSVNDSKNPFYKINFLNLETKKGSLFYNFAFEPAERWQGIIATLIHQANNFEKTIANQDSTTTYDELIKLKSLLDSGVLTIDEFNAQKEKVLKKSY